MKVRLNIGGHELHQHNLYGLGLHATGNTTLHCVQHNPRQNHQKYSIYKST